MKLITLRIDEEEKARLEQLAEERDVTLSRALREGAALFLSDRRSNAHRAKGGDSTFHGIRRDEQGRVLNKPSEPSKGESAGVASLREALHDKALRTIRQSWNAGAEPGLVLGAVGQWLSLVGRVYVQNETEVGWTWFLRDYCAPYAEAEAADYVCRQISGALIEAPSLDVGALLEALSAGFVRFLDDAEHQSVVRRQVLPVWVVLARELSE
jgi:hypothetical protein